MSSKTLRISTFRTALVSRLHSGNFPSCQGEPLYSRIATIQAKTESYTKLLALTLQLVYLKTSLIAALLRTQAL